MLDVAIIGGGITGLAAAYYLKQGPGAKPTLILIEQSAKPGGKIATERHSEFLVETGPESLVAHKPAGIAFCNALGLEPELIEPIAENRKTFVVSNRKLIAMPEGALSIFSHPISRLAFTFLTTPLLSVSGKARLMKEPFIPPKKSGEDESVESFFKRRVGIEFFQNLLEPLLSGIYGANARSLSMKTLLRPFYEAEKNHGSFFKAIRAAKNKGRKPVKSVFITLKNGLESLVEKAASTLSPEEIVCGSKVARLEIGKQGYEITLENGRKFQAMQILLCLPAYLDAQLLENVDEKLFSLLQSIPYASSTVLTFGFRKWFVKNPLQGYGYIVPKNEYLPILACTWSSSKWEGRASHDSHLLRCYADGESDPDELQAAVLTHLTRLLQIKGKPALSLIHTHPRAMPQYIVGHQERVEEIASLLERHPGLHLAGSALYGVGIADCIESGKKAAERILDSRRWLQIRSET